MELTYEETEYYIDYICSRLRFVEIDGIQFLFKQPSLKDKMRARFIYEQELKKAVNDGFITTEQMKDLIAARNLITDEDRQKITKLKSELDGQRTLLAKTTKVRARQDSIKETIKRKESELRVLEDKERTHYAMTADTKAEEARVLYLCWGSCFDFYDDTLYWKTYDAFTKESKYAFRQYVINEFIRFLNGLPTAIVRALARGSLWRIKYVTSMRTSEQLFGVPTSEYSNDMTNLVYWSHYYNNIYEMLPEDKPPDLIIEDDEALDAYMKDYYEERNRDSNTRKGRKSHGKLSAYDKEEVIVTRADPLYELIDYDQPRESKAIKDKALLNKRTRRG